MAERGLARGVTLRFGASTSKVANKASLNTALTLKHWMGWTHFLMRGIQNVVTEMSLSVLTYNFKHVLSILGFERTKKAMRLLGA